MASAVENLQVVFFDLETSGLDHDSEILQIAMRCFPKNEFNVYIKPNKPIPPAASAVNRLTTRNGELYYENSFKLVTVSQRVALGSLLQYLRKFEQPCVLVAHNCPFDAFFLMQIIKKANLVEEFRAVVVGFSDTLAMLRRKFPDRRGPGQMKLPTLAAELSLPVGSAHTATHDVFLLERVALYYFTHAQLVANRKSFAEQLVTKGY